MAKPLIKSKKRILIVFSIIFLLIVAMCLRVGWVQIVKEEEYSKKAIEQQTKDTPVAAKRGTIYDRNNTKLAISAPCFSIWVRPGDVVKGLEGTEKDLKIEETSQKLADILGMEKDEVKEFVTADKTLIKITKYQDKKTADKVREADLDGVEVAEDVKRHYPLGNFCSHVLGSVTDNNTGLSGIEMEYNNYLSGTSGRSIKDTAADGRSLTYGSEHYYAPENGTSLELTIDEVMQHYLEKGLKSAYKKHSADNVMGMIMDPKTGEILAMGSYPAFDPNDAKKPLKKKDQKKLEKMTEEEKTDFWNEMWRNNLISDTYEPGSTFKLMTLGATLEEGIATPRSHYTCSGTINVEGSVIKCWRSDDPHGRQTLKEATGNSCNPVFVQLALKLGKSKFYSYLRNFGITDITGVDFPGETSSIMLPQDTLMNSDLARVGFGQSINITPIQLVTAVSAYGNKGKLMRPHLVKAFLDDDGKVVEKVKPKVVRQVVSEDTASEVLDIMKNNVDNLGANTAKIEGYNIGGKTGTAQKTINGKISKQTYSSFIGIAPTDDPKFTILVVVDNPRGVQYGSATAGPAAKDVMTNILRYLNVQPKASD